MKMIYGIEGILLLIAALEDLRRKEIRVIYVVIMGVIAFCACFFRQDISWYGAVGGFFIGLCMIGISLISKEQIGKADGMVIAAMGVLCGVRNTLGMVCFASIFMLFPAFVVILRKKGMKQTKLPFLPALFLGYVMILFLGGMI